MARPQSSFWILLDAARSHDVPGVKAALEAPDLEPVHVRIALSAANRSECTRMREVAALLLGRFVPTDAPCTPSLCPVACVAVCREYDTWLLWDCLNAGVCRAGEPCHLVDPFVNNSAAAVRLLCFAGARPDRRDTEGRLPIAVAVRNGSVETVSALLDLGADITSEAARNSILKALKDHSRDVCELLANSGFEFEM